MNEIIGIVVVDQEPRVDSRVIASHLGVEHQNTRELIQQYQTDLEEFGLLRFETESVKNEGARGTKYQKYVLLNEDQSYLVLTYTQNTPEARNLKKRLVRSFSEYRNRPIISSTDPTTEASRLFREIGPSLRAVGIRGEKLAKGTNQVVQRLTGVDLLGMAGVDSAAPSVPDPFDLQLLACWHEVLGEQVLTAREAIYKAKGTALEKLLGRW